MSLTAQAMQNGMRAVNELPGLQSVLRPVGLASIG
jgi:hypothetical protein